MRFPLGFSLKPKPDFRGAARSAFYHAFDPKTYGFGRDVEETIYALKRLEVKHPEFGVRFGTPIPFLAHGGYRLVIPVNGEGWPAPYQDQEGRFVQPPHITLDNDGVRLDGFGDDVFVSAERERPWKTDWFLSLGGERYTYRPEPVRVRGWPGTFVNRLAECAYRRSLLPRPAPAA